MPISPRRAALLDRDGVINVDRAYVHAWEDFEFVPGAVDAMARLHAAGYLLAVVTNQSGIARGYYSEAQYAALTAHLQGHLAERGIPLAGVFHCPHLPDAPVARYAVECDCRKPKPGLILAAQRQLGFSLADSFLVGDKPSAIAAARAAGVGRAFRIADAPDDDADATFAGLAACVDFVVPR